MQITNQEIEQTIAIVGAVAYVFSHIVAVVGTPSWMPSPVINLINLVAANYAKSANVQDTKTEQ